jgi:hypothetical protein
MCLLGSHVGGSAQDGLGAGLALVFLHPFGEVEVGDLGRAVAAQEDVGRLDVAVNDAVAMGEVQGAGQRLDQPGGLPRIVRGTDVFLLQGAAVQVLQREAGPAVLLAEVVYLHDVGMLKGGEGLGLDL